VLAAAVEALDVSVELPPPVAVLEELVALDAVEVEDEDAWPASAGGDEASGAPPPPASLGTKNVQWKPEHVAPSPWHLHWASCSACVSPLL
jgi:hypothetical protein